MAGKILTVDAVTLFKSKGLKKIPRSDRSCAAGKCCAFASFPRNLRLNSHSFWWRENCFKLTIDCKSLEAKATGLIEMTVTLLLNTSFKI